MNLLEALKKEHTKAQRDRIVRFIGSDPSKFKLLVQLFLNGPYRITQRAAWPLSYCVKQHPDLVRPYLVQLIRNLNKPGLHDAVARNTFRLLQFIDLPPKIHAEAVDVSFRYFSDRQQPIATRVFAMTVAGNLCKHHPELAGELIPLIEDELPLASPAFRSRGSKTLAKLKKISNER